MGKVHTRRFMHNRPKKKDSRLGSAQSAVDAVPLVVGREEALEHPPCELDRGLVEDFGGHVGHGDGHDQYGAPGGADGVGVGGGLVEVQPDEGPGAEGEKDGQVPEVEREGDVACV